MTSRISSVSRGLLAVTFLVPMMGIRGSGPDGSLPDASRQIGVSLTIPRITLAVPIFVKPRMLQKGAKGVPVTVSVWLPSEQIAKQVLPETVVLNDTVPNIRYRGLPRLAMPPDGRRCMFAFDRQAVSHILPTGLRVEVTVSGELRSRHYLRGADVIAVVETPPYDDNNKWH